MPKIKITELPIDGKEVKKSAEGEILNFMEGKGEVALTEIIEHFNWIPWSTIIKGIGALIREGRIAYKGQNRYKLLKTEGK